MSKENGFSLLEAVVALALMSILALLSVRSQAAMIPAERVSMSQLNDESNDSWLSGHPIASQCQVQHAANGNIFLRCQGQHPAHSRVFYLGRFS